MVRWGWDTKTRRYRNLTTGRYIGKAVIVKLRDELIDGATTRVAGLAGKLGAGDLPVQDWLDGMRREVKDLTVAMYAFGKGGTDAMTPRDRGAAGALVRAQYRYLQAFARQVKAGELSAAQIAARAQLYAGAGTAAYHRGQAAAWGIKLSRHPGDGKTQCRTRCRCRLDIAEDESGVTVRWILDDAAEHCGDCTALAAEWAPLTIAR